MKKLGLIGGMGPQSTMPYYLGIVYGVQERVDEHFFPRLTIESVNVFHILDLCKDKDYGSLVEYLLDAIRNLVNAGAQFVALTANTSHIVFDELQAKSPVKLVSIIEATCDEARKRGYKKVGLIGTVFTMEEDFYKIPFRNNGIEIVVPTKRERKYVDEKISSELEFGIVTDETLHEFQGIIERMKAEEGIEGIILGCTELPLLLNDENSPVPCMDTVQIHIKALVEEIVGQDSDF